MRRRCLGCRTIIASGSYCASCRPRNGSTRAWRRLRAQALARAGGRCELCGAPATEVDHVVQVSDGGIDTISNVRALCHPCHRERHR